MTRGYEEEDDDVEDNDEPVPEEELVALDVIVDEYTQTVVVGQILMIHPNHASSSDSSSSTSSSSQTSVTDLSNDEMLARALAEDLA